MSHPVDIYRGQWRRCPDCGENYNDKSAHFKVHVERPSDDHLSLTEASKALGRADGTIRHWIRTGKLRCERLPRGPVRVWVTRKALIAFVRENIGDDFSKAEEWVRSIDG